MKVKTLLLSSFIFLMVFNISAIQVRTEKTDVIEETNFNEPYLFAGKSITFSGKTDDFYGFAEKINFSGETKYTFFGIGKNVTVNGTVGHNVYSAGSDVDLKGNIGGTVFLAGENVTINKDTVINGSVFIASSNVKIYGKINGDLYIGAGRTSINNEINGNVKAGIGAKFELLENAKINGNLFYKNHNELSKAELTKVTGNVKFEKMEMKQNDWTHKHFPGKNPFFIFGIILSVISIISLLIGGLLLLLFPSMKSFEEERTQKNFWFSSLWGLIPFFIYPAVWLTLVIFVVTIPISFILLLCALPIIFITHIAGITLSGQYLFKLFKINNTNRHLFFLFGLIFFMILSLIPWIKFLAFIFYSSLGWGFILEKLFMKKLA
jgi:hypothetical protein